MSQEWMIEVLADLQKFARRNDMKQLEEQLQDTILIATAEMKPSTNKTGAGGAYDIRTGNLCRAHQF